LPAARLWHSAAGHAKYIIHLKHTLMLTFILVMAGIAFFLLFARSIHFFDKL